MIRSGGWGRRYMLGIMFFIVLPFLHSGAPNVFAVSNTQTISGIGTVHSSAPIPASSIVPDSPTQRNLGPSVPRNSGPSLHMYSDPLVQMHSSPYARMNSDRSNGIRTGGVPADSILVPAMDMRPQDDEIMGSVRTLLPMVAYTSDLGLIGGIVLQQIRYRPKSETNASNLPPHESLIQANILATTKKRWDGEIEMEFAGWNRWRVRHQHRIEFIREPESTYFGLGNNTAFSSSDFDKGRYFYLKNWFQWESLIRRSVNRKKSSRIVDLFVKSGLIYSKSSVLSPLEGEQNELNTTILEQEQPLGIGSGRSVYVGVGLMVDGRDDELSPKKGFRYEAGITGSSSWIGSEYKFLELSGDFRHYFTLFEDHPFWEVTLAQQVRFRTVSGEQAFWQKPVLGNDDGLRGYVLDRFVGQHSALHILEARKWLISGFDDRIRLGGQFFWDSGRVFSENDSKGIFQDWKHTYGLSGLLSVLSPDIVFRVDIAFSSESQRWYAGLGYLF